MKRLICLMCVLAAVLSGCKSVDDDRTPPAGVWIVFPFQHDWTQWGVTAALQHREFVLPLGIPQGFSYSAASQTGFGGAKSFVTNELPKIGTVSKTEQIGLLNKALQYFKDHDTFDLDNFTEEVIAKPEIVENFQNFKSDFESSNDFRIDRKFQISETAIKKQQRAYRRAINLDKKIQIIINGNSDCVEKGLDSRGTFYKIYYNNEE